MFNFLKENYFETFRQDYLPEFKNKLNKFFNSEIDIENLLNYIKNNPISISETEEIIFGLRSGVGGQESKYFLLELKQKYIELFAFLNCKVTVLSSGVNSAVLSVKGSNIFKFVRLENGVHRVQRIPETERKGRVHTSVIGIFVFPKNTNKNIDLSDDFIRIDKMRASGAGGQHVNKTESAIRVTHLPTGIQAICQDGRNQHENKKSAIENLKSKLLKLQKEQQLKQDFDFVSSALQDLDRSNKNRTYNWKDDRIVNHLVDQKFPLKRVFSDKKNFFDFLVKNLIEYERVFFTELKLEYLKERCSEC